MPYADPERRREQKRRWYAERYKSDPAFREKEARRKADWLQTEEGKLSNYEATERWNDAFLERVLEEKKRKSPLPVRDQTNEQGAD